MKSEKEKKKRRKIFLSLIMILFVGVILTASTYTWFTANQTVTVNELDVNVSTSSGLQVSVDAINWKTIITRDDITNASRTYTGATNQIPADATNPVSTAGEVDSDTGFMKMFLGKLEDPEDTGTLKLTAEQVTEENGATGEFIAFDLFFQTNNTMPIQLTQNSNVAAGATDTSIENAARVAFVPQGNVAAGTDAQTAQALHATDSTGLKIWEPNFDVHTAAAVQNAQQTYGITTTQTGGSLLQYYGVKADIADGVLANSTDGTYFTDMNSTGFIISSPASGIPSTQYLNVFTLQPGITKIRVYMWVEGQDVDCENNASGGDLVYNLQFSALENAG